MRSSHCPVWFWITSNKLVIQPVAYTCNISTVDSSAINYLICEYGMCTYLYIFIFFIKYRSVNLVSNAFLIPKMEKTVPNTLYLSVKSYDNCIEHRSSCPLALSFCHIKLVMQLIHFAKKKYITKEIYFQWRCRGSVFDLEHGLKLTRVG